MYPNFSMVLSILMLWPVFDALSSDFWIEQPLILLLFRFLLGYMLSWQSRPSSHCFMVGVQCLYSYDPSKSLFFQQFTPADLEGYSLIVSCLIPLSFSRSWKFQIISPLFIYYINSFSKSKSRFWFHFSENLQQSTAMWWQVRTTVTMIDAELWNFATQSSSKYFVLKE